MQKLAPLLLALSFLLLPRPALADDIQFGDVSISMPIPDTFFEDDSFLETIRKASPQEITTHKMLIPFTGLKQAGQKRVLLDYILITTIKGSEKKIANADTLIQLEAIRDKRYDVANQASHGYSRNENREFFDALASQNNNDGVFLEKDSFDGALSYYTLMDTRGKENQIVSATTFLVVKDRLLTLGAYSRIRGKAIYNSLKIVKNMNKKLISSLRNSNQ